MENTVPVGSGTYTSRLKWPVNVRCPAFSHSCGFSLCFFLLLLVRKYCMELRCLKKSCDTAFVCVILMHVTTLKKHIAELGNQIYNNLISYLLTPMGLMKWIPADAKTYPIVQSNAVSSIKNVSVVCWKVLNHWMKTDTSSPWKPLRKDLMTFFATKISDEAYTLHLCSCRRVNKQPLNTFLHWSSLVYSFRTKNRSLLFF